MAHTFLNLGFEEGDFVPGNSVGWTITVQSSLWEIANFAPPLAAATPIEEFDEGWGNGLFDFAFGDTEFRLYASDAGPQTFDGFENNWNNNNFVTGLGPIVGALFNVGADLDENFEQGWTNDTWTGTLGATGVGLFDGGANAFENFNFNLPQNSAGYWPAMSEIQKISQGSDGASPSTLPTGVEFADAAGPLGKRIILPAGYLSSGGAGFLDVGFKAGDLFWILGSDLFDGNNLYEVDTTPPTNDTLTVIGFTWTTPGINTTGLHIMELFPAMVETGNLPPLGEAYESEYFDAHAWEEMDTL